MTSYLLPIALLLLVTSGCSKVENEPVELPIKESLNTLKTAFAGYKAKHGSLPDRKEDLGEFATPDIWKFTFKGRVYEWRYSATGFGDGQIGDLIVVGNKATGSGALYGLTPNLKVRRLN